MQHDPCRSGHDLDLRSNFKLTFEGQVTVHSMRLDKRNTMPVKVRSCKPGIKSYY